MKKNQSGQLKRKRQRVLLTISALAGFCIIGLEAACLAFMPEQGEDNAKESDEQVMAQVQVQQTLETREQQNSQGTQEQQDTGSAAESQTAERKTYARYVFVGDSRYVGMSEFAGSEDTFICKDGVGYEFLEVQMENIRQACSLKDTALIIGLGVNDVKSSSSSYISKLNRMAQEMDCSIYYMLVNPVDEAAEASYGYTVTNSRIDEFNRQMKAGLDSSIGILDTNAYLKQTGFKTADGLHYDRNTYGMIYRYIKQNL